MMDVSRDVHDRMFTIPLSRGRGRAEEAASMMCASPGLACQAAKQTRPSGAERQPRHPKLDILPRTPDAVRPLSSCLGLTHHMNKI
mmetsp:Transcript_76415/g.126738  ORF Transcript_76415/g.126738 Transcript_76415/m.126738 type:complete len:86 (+) Transcript_76415:17-274(+)